MKRDVILSDKSQLSESAWLSYFACQYLFELDKKGKINLKDSDRYWIEALTKSILLYRKFTGKQQTILINIAQNYFKYLRGVKITYENILDKPWQVEPKSDDYKNIPLNFKHTFKGKLRPFQEEGVKFCLSCNGRALIADSMGTGKTIQAIATTQRLHRFRPVLIVCPSVVKYNWASELLKFVDNPTIYILEGYVNDVKSPVHDKYLYHKGSEQDVYIIVNYDILADNTPKKKKKDDNTEVKKKRQIYKGWANQLIGNYSFLILDEVHKVKNPKAKRTKAVFSLMANANKIIALTGTPIISNIFDMYYTLKYLRPDLLKTKREFFERYIETEFNGFAHIPVGVKRNRLDELKALLSNIIIRRDKKDVIKDLPDKTKTILPVKLSGEIKAEYDKALNEFQRWYIEHKGEPLARGESLVRLEVLKQICARGKIEAVIDWANDYLSQNDENKLVIFAHHRDIIDSIASKIEKAGYKTLKLVGQMGAEKLHATAKQFQEDSSVRCIVCSIMASGIGINLTAADTALFVELPWNSVDLDQAEDRIHRIGQKNYVNIYYVIGLKTIDDYLMEILDTKRKLIDEVLTDKNVEEIEEDTLQQLVKRMFGLFHNNRKKHNDKNS